MIIGRFSGKPIGIAAEIRPTAPSPSQADAEPAAEASPSAAFFSRMTESSPVAARSGQGAPAGEGSPAGATTLSIDLSPAVALILSLVTSAKDISATEAISRGICVLAQSIGIPSLAGDHDEAGPARHANSESADLHTGFERRAPNRFRRGD